MIKKRVWLFWISSINTFFYPESFCKNAVSLWKCRRLKLRYYEKATKIWKNLPPVLTKLRSVKTSGRFFQIFVAFSEKVDSDYCVNLTQDSKSESSESVNFIRTGPEVDMGNTWDFLETRLWNPKRLPLFWYFNFPGISAIIFFFTYSICALKSCSS